MTDKHLQTDRTTVQRLARRAVYDREVIYAILDEGLVSHVAFVIDGQPYVLPTTYGRIGDRLYFHGSAGSRLMRALAVGQPVSVSVTLLDGLVLARSAFHHSMNYRSVVLLGNARRVTDLAEKRAALDAIVEHVVPGRRPDTRPPSERELLGTNVLCLPIQEASAKVRTGPPMDDEDDLTTGFWAGEIPLRLTPQEPVPDPDLAAGVAPPAYVTDYKRPGRPQPPPPPPPVGEPSEPNPKRRRGRAPTG